MKLDKKVIASLKTCDWLSSCKEKGFNLGFDFELVTDLEEISSSMFSDNWEITRFEARGEVTEFLSHNHPKAYNSFWNKGVRSIREQVIPKIEPLILDRIKSLQLDEKVYSYIRMDIINIAMVLSYGEYVHSDFYENLFEVYLCGHLPCGWNGTYPNGKMIIY